MRDTPYQKADARATHGALPHRAPSTRCTADLVHHVWHRPTPPTRRRTPRSTCATASGSPPTERRRESRSSAPSSSPPSTWTQTCCRSSRRAQSTCRRTSHSSTATTARLRAAAAGALPAHTQRTGPHRAHLPASAHCRDPFVVHRVRPVCAVQALLPARRLRHRRHAAQRRLRRRRGPALRRRDRPSVVGAARGNRGGADGRHDHALTSMQLSRASIIKIRTALKPYGTDIDRPPATHLSGRGVWALVGDSGAGVDRGRTG